MLGATPTNEKFLPLLDRELDKIVSFYKAQEQELSDEITQLAEAIAKREEEGDRFDSRFSDDADSDDEELSYGDTNLSRSMSRTRRKRSMSAGSPVATRRRSLGTLAV